MLCTLEWYQIHKKHDLWSNQGSLGKGLKKLKDDIDADLQPDKRVWDSKNERVRVRERVHKSATQSGEQNMSPKWGVEGPTHHEEGYDESAKKVWVQDIIFREASNSKWNRSLKVDQYPLSY